LLNVEYKSDGIPEKCEINVGEEEEEKEEKERLKYFLY